MVGVARQGPYFPRNGRLKFSARARMIHGKASAPQLFFEHFGQGGFAASVNAFKIDQDHSSSPALVFPPKSMHGWKSTLNIKESSSSVRKDVVYPLEWFSRICSSLFTIKSMPCRNATSLLLSGRDISSIPRANRTTYGPAFLEKTWSVTSA